MSRFEGLRFKRNERKICEAAVVVVEEMEQRVMLSSAAVPGTWSGLFTSPPGTQYYAETEVAAADPKNGDLIVAFEGDASQNAYDADMIVSAYKPNGSGGWELDTSFGGQNDDPSVGSGTPGYEIIDFNQLLGIDSADAATGDSLSLNADPTGIAVEYANGNGSGNVDILFQTGPDAGWRTFGIVQFSGPAGEGSGWGTLNSNFGNSFGPYVDNGENECNFGSNFGADGAEIIGYDPNFGSPPSINPENPGNVDEGAVFGNAIAWDPFGNDGNGDILIAGADGDPYGRYFTDVNGNRDSGGAVFAFTSNANNSANPEAGTFDASFAAGAGAVWLNQPSVAGNDPYAPSTFTDSYSEGAAQALTINFSSGTIYVAGAIVDSYDSGGGVPDQFGVFTTYFSADGVNGIYYANWLSPNYTAEMLGLSLLDNGNVILAFAARSDTSAVVEALNSGLTATTSLWSGGADSVDLTALTPGNVEIMSANPANGDIAVTSSGAYPEVVWVSGTNGTQETLSDPYGGYYYADYGTPIFISDGSLTVAGSASDGSEGTVTTLANYQFDNSTPAWLSVPSGQDPFLTWDKSSETLDLFGSATIIADPNDRPDNDEPAINAIGTSGQLTIAPTTDKTVHLESLSLQQGAWAAMATSAIPDALVLYLDGISIDQSNNSWLNATNNEIYIDYAGGSDPIVTIRQYLTSGYAGGAWDGVGISSSAANSTQYALGYADAADTGNPAGLPSGEIKIMYTLYGDANLNGIVNGSDFAIVAANFGQGVTSWDQGDFNYDGVVNGSDFSLLAANFGQGV